MYPWLSFTILGKDYNHDMILHISNTTTNTINIITIHQFATLFMYYKLKNKVFQNVLNCGPDKGMINQVMVMGPTDPFPVIRVSDA